jgi:diaminopimelate decarboxylase
MPRLARLPGLQMRGLAVHIGSQLSELAPLERAFEKLGRLLAEVRAAGPRGHPRRPRRRASACPTSPAT